MEIKIVEIKKAEKEKARIRFIQDGKKKESLRTIYTEKKNFTIVLKGITYEVDGFDAEGFAKGVRIKGTDQVVIGNQKMENIIDKVRAKTDIPQTEATKVISEGKEIKHNKYYQIKACVEAEVPVYLYGPAGSGKNHVLQQIADELGLEFYFTNSVQQEYKLTGFIDAGGNYHETEFYRAFKNGGLFFLDEMDASIPEVLVLLNAALANGYFEFPNGKINAHEDFRVVSAGNTVGTGADEQYSGRLQLDQATLDRFAMIEFDYDKNIELAIAKGNVELVTFMRSMRKQAQDQGINATFSYRSISMVQKLEGKLQLKEVLLIAVLKGLDKDTINTFKTTSENKYSKELWKLQRA